MSINTKEIILTVSQTNVYIKNIFEKNPLLNRISLKGEISNCKIHTSGHVYMSIKDEKSVISAVMFKMAANKIKFKPKDGMKIIARGKISVYERDGRYQLYIDELIQDGLGDLYIKFENLKSKLLDEGLFDKKFKKPLPLFPQKIGIATAPTGAAIRDMINILSRRFKYAEVLLIPVLVQGDKAASELCEAIKYFNKHKSVDVIIIGRGGGSIEDLWAFNEEILAREIFKSKIPIVSAVGHETDVTISDFVADKRAPTPSAAAELVVPSEIEIKRHIKDIQNKLINLIKKVIQLSKSKVEYIKRNISAPNLKTKLNDKRILIDSVTKLLIQSTKNQIAQRREIIKTCLSKLNALNPRNLLKKGYLLAKNNNGAIINSVSQLKIKDKLTLLVSDGAAICEVEEFE